jgi:hypothetical protein
MSWRVILYDAFSVCYEATPEASYLLGRRPVYSFFVPNTSERGIKAAIGYFCQTVSVWCMVISLKHQPFFSDFKQFQTRTIFKFEHIQN